MLFPSHVSLRWSEEIPWELLTYKHFAPLERGADRASQAITALSYGAATSPLTSPELFRLPAASSFAPGPNDNHPDSCPRE